jgi:hypothetical protein
MEIPKQTQYKNQINHNQRNQAQFYCPLAKHKNNLYDCEQ